MTLPGKQAANVMVPCLFSQCVLCSYGNNSHINCNNNSSDGNSTNNSVIVTIVIVIPVLVLVTRIS